MEVNISRTARAAEAGSLAPSGAAPWTTGLAGSLMVGCKLLMTSTIGAVRPAPPCQFSPAHHSRFQLCQLHVEGQNVFSRRGSFCHVEANEQDRGCAPEFSVNGRNSAQH